MDDYTLAKRLFNGKGASGENGSALSNNVTTFEALALTDSVDGYVTIDMGGVVTNEDNSRGVTVPTTVVVKKDQTVIVQNSGGSLVVIGVVGGEDGLVNDINQSTAEKIQEEGDKIRDEVTAELGPLNESFDKFKEEHQLTDDDITKTINDTKTELSSEISGAITTADEAYKVSTSASQKVDEIELSANEHYEKYDQGFIDMNSKITLNSEAIQTEVTNRQEAVSGALSDAKSYTDQQAGKISQTVEENVTSSIGNKFATKTELEQTSEDLTLTINQKVDPIDASVKEIETYFEFSTSGLDIGYNGTTTSKKTSKVRLAPDKITFSQNGTEFMEIVPNRGISAVWSKNNSDLMLYGDRGLGLFNLGDTRAVLSQEGNMYAGFESSPGVTNNITYPMGAVLLYRSQPDGYNGTINLKRGASNYVMLEIVFEDRGSTGWRRWSQRVYNPTLYYDGTHHYGVFLALQAIVGGQTGSSVTMYPSVGMYEITETQLVRRVEVTGWFSSENACGASAATGASGGTYITHVFGWR